MVYISYYMISLVSATFPKLTQLLGINFLFTAINNYLYEVIYSEPLH